MTAAIPILAAPPVSGFIPDAGINVSGVFANGQSVTINKPGGGFGVKTNVKPLYWIPLDSDLLPHPTLSRKTGSLNPDPTSVIQTAIMPPNSIGAARTKAGLSQASPFVAAPIIFQNPCLGPFPDMYCFLKRYADHSINFNAPDNINCKTLRLWPGNTSGGTPENYWGSFQTINCDGCSFFPGDSTAMSLFYGASLTANVWHTDEHIWRQSSLGVADGYMYAWRDGKSGFPATNSSHPTATTIMTRETGANNNTRGALYFDEYSNVDPHGLDYKHAIYIDDSHQRVMVSNEATISQTSSTREICIPTVWNDTSISCILRQGALAGLSGIYLWAWTDINTQIRLGQFA